MTWGSIRFWVYTAYMGVWTRVRLARADGLQEPQLATVTAGESSHQSSSPGPRTSWPAPHGHCGAGYKLITAHAFHVCITVGGPHHHKQVTCCCTTTTTAHSQHASGRDGQQRHRTVLPYMSDRTTVRPWRYESSDKHHAETDGGGASTHRGSPWVITGNAQHISCAADARAVQAQSTVSMRQSTDRSHPTAVLHPQTTLVPSIGPSSRLVQQRRGPQPQAHACSSRVHQLATLSDQDQINLCHSNASRGRCIGANGRLLQPACTFPSLLNTPTHEGPRPVSAKAHDTRLPHASSPSHAIVKPWGFHFLPYHQTHVALPQPTTRLQIPEAP